MGMDWKVRVIVFCLSLIWLLIVIRMVKSRRIWEKYAIFWIYVGLAVLLVPLFVDFFDWLLLKLGVDQPPNFFFLLGILGVLLILLQTSVELTSLVRQSRNTIQDMAILEERVRNLEKELAARAAAQGLEGGAT